MQSVTEQDLVPFNREKQVITDPEGVRALLQMDVSETESSFNEPDETSDDLKNSVKSAPKGHKTSVAAKPRIATEPVRVSGLIEPELSERLKNYVIFMMAHDETITVQRVISEAIEIYMFEREEEYGDQFPLREVEIKRGRRPKSK